MAPLLRYALTTAGAMTATIASATPNVRRTSNSSAVMSARSR
jgi:hypothetical protein